MFAKGVTLKTLGSDILGVAGYSIMFASEVTMIEVTIANPSATLNLKPLTLKP